MGEDVASLAETYAEDPYKSKLIGKTEKLDDTKYKNRYAEAHGIEILEHKIMRCMTDG